VRHVVGVDISATEQSRDFGNLTFNSKIAILNLKGVVWWDQLESVRALYHEYIFSIFSEKVRVDNDIILVGEYIRSRGLSLACVTNRDYQVALFALDRCGVLPSVQYIITPDQVPMGKPARFGYDLALKYCGSQPHEAIAFETSAIGIAAARAAGCRAYKVRRGTRLDIDRIKPIMDEDHG
jgi:HAD superfamily hydrolase (TIGR01509 family)